LIDSRSAIITGVTAAAAAVRQARQARGWSQRKLAVRAGVPQSTIGRIEAGLVDPRTSTVERILRACGENFGTVERIGEGVDRTQMWELFRLTPGQRLDTVKQGAAWFETLRRARTVRK
jgi:transcriptional regulator with XRE-family HTH domain